MGPLGSMNPIKNQIMGLMSLIKNLIMNSMSLNEVILILKFMKERESFSITWNRIEKKTGNQKNVWNKTRNYNPGYTGNLYDICIDWYYIW